MVKQRKKKKDTTHAHYPKRARTGVASADEKQRCTSMNERRNRPNSNDETFL